MGRYGTLLGTGLLVGTAAFQPGCSNNSGPLLSMTSNAPTVEVFFPEIKDRPSEVAFISRCALAYGYEHDPAKVRAAYLSYEAKRGTKPPQLSAIEKDYDATYQAIGALGHRQNSFCATKDGEQVRSELRRFTSGYFDSKSPTPTTASIAPRKP